MLLRAFLVSIVLTFGVSNTPNAVHATDLVATTPTMVPIDDDTTRPTINEFMPEDQALSDCLSSLPKPGCGSEARGGWRQTVVFVVIIGAIALIFWRVVASSRKARQLPPLRKVLPDIIRGAAARARRSVAQWWSRITRGSQHDS